MLVFRNTGISILFKKPTTKVTTLFSFLSPFTGLVWISLLSAYIVVSTILFIVGRMSPYEWENPNPCQQDDDVLENNFSLTNSFFFTIGSMMQQGSELTPKYVIQCCSIDRLTSNKITSYLQSNVYKGCGSYLVFFHVDYDQ